MKKSMISSYEAACRQWKVSEMDDPAKGGLTQFWEIFTVILCAYKDFKR